MYTLGYKYIHVCDDRTVIVQDVDGVTIEDGDDGAGEVGGKSFVRTKNYCPKYKHTRTRLVINQKIIAMTVAEARNRSGNILAFAKDQ